ncbi:porin, partial [Myxococcota bacterium]|nr:porin [Myxococcota bacterium]
MRSSWNTLVAVAAALVIGPQIAVADDVQEQLRQMQARMAQLEDSLQATQDELNTAQDTVQEQQMVIERSGLDEERSGLSALSSFLNETEFGGVAAASYNINFRNPEGTGVGLSPAAGTPGSNTSLGAWNQNNNFQVDQLHFSMANAATADSRAGFGVDIIYGQTTGANAGTAGGTDNPQIVQAYASYLAPIGGGIEIKGGRWDTIIGAEVVYVGQNYNITRGITWNMQPVSHNGLMLSGDLGSNLSWSAAVANSYSQGAGSNGNLDANGGKNGIFGLAWDGGTMGLNVAYMYSTDPIDGATVTPFINNTPTNVDDSSHMVDVIASWNPSDNLGVYVNFDYLKTDQPGAGEISTKGLAAASRLAISDTTGIAARFEYLSQDVAGTETTWYTVTGTVDHALTDNLTARAEIRWDM